MHAGDQFYQKKTCLQKVVLKFIIKGIVEIFMGILMPYIAALYFCKRYMTSATWTTLGWMSFQNQWDFRFGKEK